MVLPGVDLTWLPCVSHRRLCPRKGPRHIWEAFERRRAVTWVHWWCWLVQRVGDQRARESLGIWGTQIWGHQLNLGHLQAPGLSRIQCWLETAELGCGVNEVSRLGEGS